MWETGLGQRCHKPPAPFLLSADDRHLRLTERPGPAPLQALAGAAFLPGLRELVLWQRQEPDVVPLPLPEALAHASALEVLDCGPCMGGLQLRSSDGAMLCALPALRRVVLPCPEDVSPDEGAEGADVARQHAQRRALDDVAAELAAVRQLQVEEASEGHPCEP